MAIDVAAVRRSAFDLGRSGAFGGTVKSIADLLPGEPVAPPAQPAPGVYTPPAQNRWLAFLRSPLGIVVAIGAVVGVVLLLRKA